MNRIFFICIIIFLSQKVNSQKSVIDYLESYTLSEFVESCNFNEEMALQLLFQIKMSDTINLKYTWYDVYDLRPELKLRSSSYYPHRYASLKIKAYSWIIRIFKEEYDECGNYLYDFGYYDYCICNHKKNFVEVCKYNETSQLIISELNKWFAVLDCYGLQYMRQRGQPPISPKYYSIRSNAKNVFNSKYDYERKQISVLCNVSYFLKNKTLSEFVINCDFNEYLALHKLYGFNLSNVCSDSMMWYSKEDRMNCFNHIDTSLTKQYASLKLKAYSWIIRIFMSQYDECGDYLYDFGFYDYIKVEEESDLVFKRKDVDPKEYSIKESIDKWFEFIEKKELWRARFDRRTPIRIIDYNIFNKKQ